MGGVVRGGPVDHAVALLDRVVIGQRDGLGMGNEKTVKVPRLRSPRANPGAGAGTIQIDGAARPDTVAPAVRGEMLLVGAPSQLGRLRAFADEAVHRPSIDELVGLLRRLGYLSVPLGDVDDLDPELLGELGPVRASRRRP